MNILPAPRWLQRTGFHSGFPACARLAFEAKDRFAEAIRALAAALPLHGKRRASP
jgi:hypothetical protein